MSPHRRFDFGAFRVDLKNGFWISQRNMPDDGQSKRGFAINLSGITAWFANGRRMVGISFWRPNVLICDLRVSPPRMRSFGWKG